MRKKALSIATSLALQHFSRFDKIDRGKIADAVTHRIAHVCLQYEDPVAQALALSVMPVDELQEAAREASDVSVSMGEDPALAQEDALAQGILDWFKGSFFSWVRA